MRNIGTAIKAAGIALTFSTASVATTLATAAETYPANPVRLIVPVAPGGSVDILARVIATELSKRLGKQVVADNRAGASGVIALELAAKASPNGYTLVFINGTQSIQPAFRKLPYEPVKSFTPVAKVGVTLFAVVVHPSVPARSLKELISLTKRKPDALIFVGAGSGSIQHMATELFKLKAGIDFRIVQFKGAGPAVIDLVGGHSDGSVGTLPSVLPHIQSGKLRVLATTGSKRSGLLPEVPTVAEAGLPGYEAANWYGILAPAGTQASVVEKLNLELKAVLASDETQKVFVNNALEPDYLGPAEFGAFFLREIDQWARVTREARITLDQ